MNLWINEFKLAILNENEQEIEKLSKNMPTNFKDKELKIASALTKEAIKVLEKKRKDVALSLNQLKNLKKYTT